MYSWVFKRNTKLGIQVEEWHKFLTNKIKYVLLANRRRRRNWLARRESDHFIKLDSNGRGIRFSKGQELFSQSCFSSSRMHNINSSKNYCCFSTIYEAKSAAVKILPLGNRDMLPGEIGPLTSSCDSDISTLRVINSSRVMTSFSTRRPQRSQADAMQDMG